MSLRMLVGQRRIPCLQRDVLLSKFSRRIIFSLMVEAHRMAADLQAVARKTLFAMPGADRMWRKSVLFTVLVGSLAFSSGAFAINRNGRVVGSGVFGGPGSQFGSVRNHGVAGAGPFVRAGGMGGRLIGGPHVGGTGVIPKK
jgi:hypothetical protein